ncbi:MAG: PAS domain S-box protein [Rhodovibrionaceae bacterium]
MLANEDFFRSHPDPMWIYDLETLRFLAVNDAAIERYGYSEEEFLGLTIKDIRPKQDVAALLDDVARKTEDLGNSGIWRHLRRDGRKIHVEIVSRGIAYDGRAARLVRARDVTRQVEIESENAELFEREKQARLQAEESASLLRVASRAAKLGGWIVQKGADRVFWTDETAAIHDLPPGTHPKIADAIGFYPPEYRERIEQLFNRAMETGEPFDEVLQIATANGRRIWIRSIGEPLRDSSGELVAVHGAFQDIGELVAARQETQALSERLAETLDNISDAFMTMDREWRFTFINIQAQRILQRSKDELLGKVVWEAFPEAIGSTFEERYRYAIEHKLPVTFVEYFPPLDTWFNVTAYPTREGLAIYFQDISDQREQQERLRLLETAVSRLNDIVIITEGEPIDSPGPRIVYVNDAFERITGYNSADAIGANPRILQGPHTQRETLDSIRQALEAKHPLQTKLINYTRGGEEIVLELDIVPIENETGACTHFVSVERDITARVAAEAEMRLNEERFRLLAKATSDVIWDWDFEADRLWWNEGLLAKFGYDPETVDPGPESWSDRIHPDDRARVVSSIHAVIDGTESYWEAEYGFLRADGSTAQVSDCGYVIRNAQGEALRMLGSMIDDSERRELREQLLQAQKLETVGQLTGGVAHDFNNLLTVILGNSEELAEGLSQDPGLRALAEMSVNAAERAAELTNRLLAFSRQQALEPQKLDVNQLLSRMLSMLRRTMNEDIEIALHPGEDIWNAFVDPGQLEVAILNLTINARDAMQGGGRLTIETANASLDRDYAERHQEVLPGDYVRIAISDNGTGMPREVVERVFEPFFTTKEVGKGSGLGLSMVFGFIKQSRGHIKLYSEVGEGTTVALYLPRLLASEQTEAEPRPQHGRVAGGPESILVVEDDPLVLEYASSQLRGLGYRVVTATSGPEALECLAQHAEIDLLFTDVVMPGGMNGAELARQVAGLRPDIKVLFTSGYTENAIIHSGRLDPGVQLLHKPYGRTELASKIRQALDG